MRTLIVVLLALAGCGHKDSEPVSAGSSSAPAGSGSTAAPKPADAAPVAVAPDAAVPDAAVAAAVGKVCCCESTGDATHYTIEGDPAACTADDMRGSCGELKECDLAAEPVVLAAGKAVTVEAAGLLAIWPTKEAKAFGALEITLKGKDAVLRTNSNDDEGFKERTKFPAAPGPITVTPQTDGTALVSNGKTTWVLAQDYRYGKITVKKRK